MTTVEKPALSTFSDAEIRGEETRRRNLLIEAATAGASLDDDYLGNMVKKMVGPLTTLNNNVDLALSAMGTDSGASDPQKLANYQLATSQYNIYRQLVSSAIKEKRDLDLAIIRNIG